MGALQAKEDWVDSIDDGEIACKSCRYRTNTQEHLDQHTNKYHPKDGVTDDMFVYYMDCNGSIEGRNVLCEYVDVQWIDCTGGQAAFRYDPDYSIQQFGDDLVRGARGNGLKLGNVLKMFDPGLGLDFPMWWVNAGVEAGVFERYQIPDDVQAHWGDDEQSNDDSSEESSGEKREREPDNEDGCCCEDESSETKRARSDEQNE